VVGGVAQLGERSTPAPLVGMSLNPGVGKD
jgi:hypothetical protein